MVTYFIIQKDAKVMKIFDSYVKDGLEYLNFKCDVKNLIIAYPIINIDCIDMERSKYKVYKGDKDRIQRFDKLLLIEILIIKRQKLNMKKFVIRYYKSDILHADMFPLSWE